MVLLCRFNKARMLIVTRENMPAQHSVATPSHVGDNLGKRRNHFIYINGFRFTAERAICPIASCTKSETAM
jgi:hypothetical protein